MYLAQITTLNICFRENYSLNARDNILIFDWRLLFKTVLQRKRDNGASVGIISHISPLRPSHQTLKRCPSGWGKGLSCCPSLRYFIKHICQNELDNERSFLAKHEAVRPTKYLVWQRNGSKNGVPSFDYL